MPTPEVAAVGQDCELNNVQLARGSWKRLPADSQPPDDERHGAAENEHSVDQEQLAGARFYLSFHLQGVVKRVGLPHMLV